MRFALSALAVVLLVTSAGCMQSSYDSFAPKEDVAVAKGYIDDLRAGRVGEIEALADPTIQSPDLHATLLKIASVFPAGEPKSIKIVGVNLGKTPYSTSDNLSFEYEYANEWVLTNVAVQKKDGKSTIFGIGAYPLSDSLEHANRFTFSGKGITAYLFLVLAVLVPLFIIGVLVLCIRTKDLRRKWLWVIFILLGIGGFTLNWTTGQVTWQLLHFQVVGAGFFTVLYGPVTITVAAPVGAVWFLIKWLRRPLSPVTASVLDTAQ